MRSSKGGRLKKAIAENQNICYDRFQEHWIESSSQSTSAGSRVIFRIDAVYLRGDRAAQASIHGGSIRPDAGPRKDSLAVTPKPPAGVRPQPIERFRFNGRTDIWNSFRPAWISFRPIWKWFLAASRGGHRPRIAFGPGR